MSVAPPGGSFTGPVANVTLTASEPASIVYTARRLGPADLRRRQPGREVLRRRRSPISDKDANGAAVASVTLRYVAFDSAGNPSLAHTEIYKFGAGGGHGRAAPRVKAVARQRPPRHVTWTAPVAGTSPITGYTITGDRPRR